MGFIAASFDALPASADLPGLDWGVDDLAPFFARYDAARRVFIALDVEPEDEIARDTANRARDYKRELETAVRSYVADASRVPFPPREETVRNLIAEAQGAIEATLRDIRPALRGGLVDALAVSADLSQARSRLSDAEARFSDLEEKARAVIERVGVGRLAAHYEAEAGHQAAASRRWLVGVGLTGLILAAVVIWLLVEVHSAGGSSSWESTASMLATKALTLGVLSFAASFCTRNYRSHRHLHTIYRQRMAALDTYSLMALSLREEPEERRLVLTELAKAVFSPADTGLSTSNGDKTFIENTVPIVSAVRGGS